MAADNSGRPRIIEDQMELKTQSGGAHGKPEEAKEGAAGGIDGSEALARIDAKEKLESELAAQAKPKGSAAGLEHLRAAFDPNAHVMFTVPAKRSTSRVVGWDHALVEIEDSRRIVIIQDNEDGSFRIYAEMTGRDPEKIAADLRRFYTV